MDKEKSSERSPEREAHQVEAEHVATREGLWPAPAEALGGVEALATGAALPQVEESLEEPDGMGKNSLIFRNIRYQYGDVFQAWHKDPGSPLLPWWFFIEPSLPLTPPITTPCRA